MEYIIGIILFIITIIIVGLILRKRVYDHVDRQENWKMDIMNRNVAGQLARIKGLNLTGETQEKFETWKKQWESIVSKELPDVEELLFDAEEAADRYRFPTAKKVLHKIDHTLNSIENDIEKILHELDELLEYEKVSRKEIEELQPNLKALRKQLSQNRYKYGKAEVRFDIEIDVLEEKLKAYFDLVDSGDYTDAKQLVDELKQELEQLTVLIDEFPSIYKMCKDDLPGELDDLYSGIKNMINDGYRVEQHGFEKEIHDYQQRLLDCIRSLENGDISEVEIIISEMRERIPEIYELLEKEAVAKNYIETQIPNYQNMLEELSTTFYNTKTEVDSLRKAYYFEDSDMERYLLLDKSITRLKNQLDEISSDMEKGAAYSEIRVQLENGFQQLEELQEKHNEFQKQIHNLRKDELEAKEKLSEMHERINTLKRNLKKSNIPGVPNFIWDMMEEALQRNNRVIKALEKQPLDIAEVQHALSDSKAAVDNVSDQIEMMLDQAYLTEQVIQYANRYRSRYPILAAKLVESERLFRSYEYELSLEQVAKAVEEIEPGALKRIEAYQEEEEAIN